MRLEVEEEVELRARSHPLSGAVRNVPRGTVALDLPQANLRFELEEGLPQIDPCCDSD